MTDRECGLRTGTEAIPSGGPDRAARARRDFLVFWISGAVDGLGTHASSLFLPLILLSAGGPPALAGAVASVSLVGHLVASPFAGVLADRADRRTLMVRSALVASCAMGSVFAAVACGRISAPHILLAALVERVASALYAAAGQGMIRRIVPPGRYATAVSRLQARDEGVQIAGPSLGGALFQLARWLPVLADALSFLCVAALTRALRTDGAPTGPARTTRFTDDLREGLRFVRHEPFLRFVALWSSGVNGVVGVLYFAAVLAAQERGAGGAATGLILTVSGLCGLAGALAAPWAVRRLGPALIVVSGSWLMVPAAAGLGLVTSTWAYGLLLGSVSFTAPAAGVVLRARVVLLTPDRLQGRVSTVLGTASRAVAALAPVTAGLLASAAGGRTVAFGSAGALAVLAVYCTLRGDRTQGAAAPRGAAG
ncbi:MFS transporter [Streptomyces luteireticuli]|uniref:MFS transporter n=1 Tax=Streptomyces luteireticuli TaxID=173858 RepID=A0ABN0YLZ9_9ACTN